MFTRREATSLLLASSGGLLIPGHANAQPTKGNISERVVDVFDGIEIDRHNNKEREKRLPASLVKLMPIYELMLRLQDGRLTFNDTMIASKRAESQEPSKIGIRAGERITVHEAICALVVRSANDVAVVVAEHLGEGSHDRFIKMINERALSLGMWDTRFMDASGLHDSEDQYSTAKDITTLMSRMIQDMPFYYNTYFQRKEYYWKGEAYDRGDRNRLFKSLKIDGIKTGYTSTVGFNAAATYPLLDGGKRIVVVMQAKTARGRLSSMKSLIKI